MEQKKKVNRFNPFPDVPCTYKSKGGDLFVHLETLPHLEINETIEFDYDKGEVVIYGVNTGSMTRISIPKFQEKLRNEDLTKIVSVR